MPGRSRSRPAWTRPSSDRPSRRSSPSSPGCATSSCPTAELEKAKRYLAGGMELRMDDTRHVASWIGGQEALHDRVLDLDEALAAVIAVDAASIQRARRRPSSATTSCGWRPWPRPVTCAASSRACTCRRDGPARPRGDRRGGAAAQADRRPTDLTLARLHLRTGSLALARAEFETLAGRGRDRRRRARRSGRRPLADRRPRERRGRGDVGPRPRHRRAGRDHHRRRIGLRPRPARARRAGSRPRR